MMDVTTLHCCVVTFLPPLVMWAINTRENLLSLLARVSKAYTAIKAFGRTFARSRVFSIVTLTIASFFAASIANYIVKGVWPRLLLTYVFALEIFFDVDDPLRMTPKSLGFTFLRQPTAPNIDVEVFTSLRTFDITQPFDYVLPIVEGLVVTLALWPAYKVESTAKLFLCITLVFYATTLQFQKFAVLLKHRVQLASKASLRRPAAEATDQKSSIAPAFIVETWQKEVGIPEINVVDADASPENCVPKSPEFKPIGARGLGPATRPTYNAESLMPTDASITSRAEIRPARKATGISQEGSRSSSPAAKERKARRIAGLQIDIIDKKTSELIAVRSVETGSFSNLPTAPELLLCSPGRVYRDPCRRDRVGEVPARRSV